MHHHHSNAIAKSLQGRAEKSWPNRKFPLAGTVGATTTEHEEDECKSASVIDQGLVVTCV